MNEVVHYCMREKKSRLSVKSNGSNSKRKISRISYIQLEEFDEKVKVLPWSG